MLVIRRWPATLTRWGTERAYCRDRRKIQTAPTRERAALEEELARLESRRETHLPTLLTLVEMARDGRKIRLPLLNRVMPLICDEWAKPQLGSGCVKITPAHDPNDYAVWTRHQQEIDSINILNEDGTLNANAGPYAGLIVLSSGSGWCKTCASRICWKPWKSAP
jgi:valyl-tRNA synthetase